MYLYPAIYNIAGIQRVYMPRDEVHGKVTPSAVFEKALKNNKFPAIAGPRLFSALARIFGEFAIEQLEFTLSVDCFGILYLGR